jgi:hypothetical protein
MKQYKICIIYDIESEEGYSEELSVTANSLEMAVARLNDFEDPVSKHLPKVFEINKIPTIEINQNILTTSDLSFLDSCKFAF